MQRALLSRTPHIRAKARNCCSQAAANTLRIGMVGAGSGSGGENGLGSDDRCFEFAPILPDWDEKLSPWLNDVSHLAGGSYHSIGVTDDGTVFAWGRGGLGRLGLPDEDNVFAPRAVARITDTVASLSAGASHSVLRTEDGAVYTWGYNGFKQAGHPTGTAISQPKRLPAFLTAVERGKALREQDAILENAVPSPCVACVAGASHSGAVLESGAVYTWGMPDHMRLGHSDDGDARVAPTSRRRTSLGVVPPFAMQSTPVPAIDLPASAKKGRTPGPRRAPVRLTGGSLPAHVPGLPSDVRHLWLGPVQSFAGTESGALWAWGGNQFGELGVGDPLAGADDEVAAPIQVTGGALDGEPVTFVLPCARHTYVGTASGRLLACGSAGYGTLGGALAEEGAQSARLVAVPGFGPAGPLGAVRRGWGSAHHVVVETDDGAVFVWGENSHGQLGVGARHRVLAPHRVDLQACASTLHAASLLRKPARPAETLLGRIVSGLTRSAGPAPTAIGEDGVTSQAKAEEEEATTSAWRQALSEAATGRRAVRVHAAAVGALHTCLALAVDE